MRFKHRSVKVLKRLKPLPTNLILQYQVLNNLKMTINKYRDRERASNCERRGRCVRERRELFPTMLFRDGIDLQKSFLLRSNMAYQQTCGVLVVF